MNTPPGKTHRKSSQPATRSLDEINTWIDEQKTSTHSVLVLDDLTEERNLFFSSDREIKYYY